MVALRFPFLDLQREKEDDDDTLGQWFTAKIRSRVANDLLHFCKATRDIQGTAIAEKEERHIKQALNQNKRKQAKKFQFIF